MNENSWIYLKNAARMKRIVVTTDLSKKSKAAFSDAKAIAEAFGAEIDLLAIIEDPAQAAMIYALDYPVLPSPDIREQFVEKVKVDLQELAKEHFADLSVECHVLEAEGPVHVAIIDYIKRSGAEMLILSTHGRSGLSRLLLGSVAEKLVREAPCPMLIVPAGHQS
jgi:nucleotide-binding universal stress UspA family protein